MSDPRKKEPGVDPRVLFAAERTLLAWVRTGLSLMGFGFALARFGLYLREIATPTASFKTPHFSVSVGIVLVGFGVGTNVLAVAQHVRVIRRLRSGETEFEATLSPGVLLAGALGLLGLGGCLYLLTL